MLDSHALRREKGRRGKSRRRRASGVTYLLTGLWIFAVYVMVGGCSVDTFPGLWRGSAVCRGACGTVLGCGVVVIVYCGIVYVWVLERLCLCFVGL